MSDDNRTSGMGLWTDANEMLRAAKHLMAVKQFALSQPLYFLLGHALELAFKSYIRAKGASLNSLRTVGHDLVAAKELAVTAGIEESAWLDKQEHLAIAMLNEYYRRKEFEYRVTGVKIYPEAKLLVELVEKLLNGTHDVCLKSIQANCFLLRGSIHQEDLFADWNLSVHSNSPFPIKGLDQ